MYKTKNKRQRRRRDSVRYEKKNHKGPREKLTTALSHSHNQELYNRRRRVDSPAFARSYDIGQNISVDQSCCHILVKTTDLLV